MSVFTYYLVCILKTIMVFELTSLVWIRLVNLNYINDNNLGPNSFVIHNAIIEIDQNSNADKIGQNEAQNFPLVGQKTRLEEWRKSLSSVFILLNIDHCGEAVSFLFSSPFAFISAFLMLKLYFDTLKLSRRPLSWK